MCREITASGLDKHRCFEELTLPTVSAWQEVTFTFGEKKYSMKEPLRKLEITFQSDLIQLNTDKSDVTDLSPIQVRHPGYLEKWRNGRLGLGGLLGEIKIACVGFIS